MSAVETEPAPTSAAARDKDWVAGRTSAAMEAVRASRPAELHAVMDEILTRAPDAAAAFRLAAEFSSRENDWLRAVRYRAALAAIDPADRMARLALAKALEKAGARQAAEDIVHRAQSGAPVGAGLRRLRLKLLLAAEPLRREPEEIDRLLVDLAQRPASEGVGFVLEVAQILTEARAFELAGAWLARARPAHGHLSPFARLEATVAYRRRRWDEAERLWRALAEDGDAATVRAARLYRARIALSDDRRDDATELYREAFGADPADGEAARHLVRTAIAQGRLEEAADDLAKFEAATGRSPLGVQLRAALATGRRDMAAAVAEFEGGLAEWPDDIDLRCRYADFHSDLGDLGAASNVIAQAEARAPAHPGVLARRLSFGIASGEAPDPLLELAERLLRERPDDLTVMRQKANLLIRLGQRWEAVATLRQGVAIDSRNVGFHTGAIVNLLILNENEEAARAVDEGLAVFAGESCAQLMAQAELLEAGDRLAEAVERAEQACAADPVSPQALALAARLLETRGLYRRAWPLLLALRELDGSGARAALSFARIGRALAFVDSDPAAASDGEIFPDALMDRLGREAAGKASYAAEDRVLQVTSSLAAGGAERQVALTIQGLAARPGAPAPELAAQDLSPLVGRDFFLTEVEAAGVPIWALNRLRAEGAAREIVAAHAEHRETVGLLSAMPTDIANVALPLLKVIIERRPRVVHLWQDSINIAGGMAAMAAGVPKIVLGTRSTRPIERQRARRWLHAGYHALLHYPGAVVLSNSQNGAADYADWLGAASERIVTVYNGFDFAAMHARLDPAASSAIRERLAAGSEEVVVGGIMRCSFEKRPELWAETVIHLAKADSRIRGVLVGEGPMRPALEQQVANEGLAERILFVGLQTPIEPWIAAMDVVFLSSLTEGLPNVLIEAQALGVAAATMRVGGAPETVIENETAVVIDNGPVPAVAAALAPLTRDAALRARFGAAGRVWTDRAFSLDALAQRLTEIYRA